MQRTECGIAGHLAVLLAMVLLGTGCRSTLVSDPPDSFPRVRYRLVKRGCTPLVEVYYLRSGCIYLSEVHFDTDCDGRLDRTIRIPTVEGNMHGVKVSVHPLREPIPRFLSPHLERARYYRDMPDSIPRNAASPPADQIANGSWLSSEEYRTALRVVADCGR